MLLKGCDRNTFRCVKSGTGLLRFALAEGQGMLLNVAVVVGTARSFVVSHVKSQVLSVCAEWYFDGCTSGEQNGFG